MRNDKIVNVKITRHELCQLKLACTSLMFGENGEKLDDRKHWEVLRDKLGTILDEWDKTHDDEGMKI